MSRDTADSLSWVPPFADFYGRNCAAGPAAAWNCSSTGPAPAERASRTAAQCITDFIVAAEESGGSRGADLRGDFRFTETQGILAAKFTILIRAKEKWGFNIDVMEKLREACRGVCPALRPRVLKASPERANERSCCGGVRAQRELAGTALCVACFLFAGPTRFTPPPYAYAPSRRALFRRHTLRGPPLYPRVSRDGAHGNDVRAPRCRHTHGVSGEESC